MNDIHGLHHAGIVTRDLDALEHTYRRLGFALTPRSRHLMSERPGEPPTPGCTANLCAIFAGSYLELLGIVDESAPDPWHARQIPDGLRLLNLETDDAEAADRRLRAAGLRTSGVLELERDVDTEFGVCTASARAVHLDPGTTDEGYIGLAQHLTRGYIHQARYQRHPNTARDIGAVVIVAVDGFDGIVERYRTILSSEPARIGRRQVFETGGFRLEVVRAADAGKLLVGEQNSGRSRLAALTVVVDDLDVAHAVVTSAGTPVTPTPDGFFVSPSVAHGAGLFFTAR